MSLNLDNFETEYSSHTPYILTSPRSLKACSLLRIEPVELVYRSLEEYEEALCDLPLSEIYRIYEENETKRQGLLLKCREQRENLRHNCSIMAVQQEQASSTTTEEEDNSSVQRIRPNSQRHNNPEYRSSVRSDTRSASSIVKKNNDKNVNNKSSVSPTRRFMSAPSTHKNNKHNKSGSQPNLSGKKKGVDFTRNNLKSSLIMSSPRSRSGSGRRGLVFQTSDTESTTGEDGRIHTLLIDNPFYAASRSVPDLRCTKSNLDWRKVSPRNNCPCNWEVPDSSLLAEYLKQYSDIIDSPDLTFEDRKIMECLILKRGKEMEWEKKSQEMRKILEKERIQKWTENQLMMQSWHEKLAEKRHFENIENNKRYLDLQDKWKSSRSNLMTCLEERDRKVQRYLEDMNYKKKKSLLEKQKREALRQLEVGKAIEKLVEEDRTHRQILKDKLQRQMEEADVRKRRRERDYCRHVSEMNRMEDIKRTLKLEQLEQKTRSSLEDLKAQIEEKEHRAHLNYLNRIRLRDRTLSEGGGNRQKAMEKVQSIHSDLLKGLEEWHKKVLELHMEAQKRAEIKYNQEIHRRRIRVASDRILREERSSEMLRRVQELEEQKRGLLKAVIESKECKTARVKADKERKVQISRIRAQHAAELRQQLKDKLAPETFAKKAARAEMELRIMKRNPPSGFSVRFNPKLISKQRCSSCYSSNGGFDGGRSRRTSHNHSHSHLRHINNCGGGGSAKLASGFGGPVKCLH